jgi:hypothetical protein
VKATVNEPVCERAGMVCSLAVGSAAFAVAPPVNKVPAKKAQSNSAQSNSAQSKIFIVLENCCIGFIVFLLKHLL